MNEDMTKQPESYWKKKLTPTQYRLVREKGTEPPFTGKYVNNHQDGTYRCVACEQALFSNDTKFESGSGWPSFTDPVNIEHIELHDDNSFGMRRTEVRCKNCGSHLGHLFPLVPPGLGCSGYCINSAALDFKASTD